MSADRENLEMLKILLENIVGETFLMVPSPTPFCPASNSSRSLKLRGITRTKQQIRSVHLGLDFI